MSERSTVKPALKWAGGKRWLIPRLQPLWSKHSGRRLVEPFCGGLAVSLGLTPERALLNDINTHAVNFYCWLQQGLDPQVEMRQDKDLYYTYRERFNSLVKAGKDRCSEAAELFYYLNRTCYNGLCRFNSKGEFNVPYGSYESIRYERDFSAYRLAFQGWEFRASDFQSLDVGAEDFIYADPPYDASFTRYAKEDFTWDDQVRLAQWLAAHPGPVVLSNQATGRIMALYDELGFELTTLEAPRMISSNGDRSRAIEVLATRGV